jgi:hypothetical protein
MRASRASLNLRFVERDLGAGRAPVNLCKGSHRASPSVSAPLEVAATSVRATRSPSIWSAKEDTPAPTIGRRRSDTTTTARRAMGSNELAGQQRRREGLPRFTCLPGRSEVSVREL